MSRSLNVASALLFIVGIVGALDGLMKLFLLVPLDEGLLGVTVSQIRDLSPNLLEYANFAGQLLGLEILGASLYLIVISLIPYRKGEKWAWYTVLVIGGFTGTLGILIILYIYATILPSLLIPLDIILTILWIVGLALPAKEILGKHS